MHIQDFPCVGVCIPHDPLTSANELIVNTCFRHSWFLLFLRFFSKRLENMIHLLPLSFISFTGCSWRVSRKSSKALSDQSSFFIWFLLFILLVGVIISNFLILWLLMQTVSVYVICLVTFIVEITCSSAFFLEDEFCGILSTFFPVLPLPLSFLFLSLFPVSSDVWYAGFVDLITSLSIWKDTGILE